MTLKALFTPLFLLVAGTASADLTSGYYRIKSNAYEGRYMGENCSSHQLYTTTNNSATNYALVWYVKVSGSSVTIKNALTDRYIQKQGTYSADYSTGTSSVSFTLSQSSPYTFEDYSGSGLHCAATQGYSVVHWYTSDDNPASFWLMESASVDQEELNSQKTALASADASALTTYFTSTACTALNSSYASMSDADLRSAMSSLPESVQDLAVKVKNNAWTTYSGWSKTEATFRIADYKAYSSHTRWTNILGFSHSMGRLSNPTGIWVDDGEIIQVYVGTIPSGQSVALEVAGYGQSSGQQYPLHEGMNVLQITGSGNCFVFYEVDNTNNGGTPYTALSGYDDVTVHIEGGTVQGYFDLTEGDTDTDWEQMKAFLLTDHSTRPSVCLKTDKHVMNLGIDRLISALNGSSLTAMLNVWQDLSEWEDDLCGRSDAYGGQTRYGQYCNNVYSVTALPGTDGSPHATNYGTYYYEYSDPLIFNADALLTVSDNLWCIAHEQGHNRQTPINMVGTTETSNNVFSNMAVYKQGRYTSRTASIKDVFHDYIDGISWPERIQRANNNVGSYNAHILHLNWSLYLFFHVLGNAPDFFPRLYDALRADPMTKVSGSGTLTPASTDYLKYYVKCCEVSGYDLTDFFASYGFFMLPPEQASSITYNGVTTNLYQSFNDYADYNLYVTQDMIDAAREEVKAMDGLKAGSGIVFIEDRVEAPAATYDGHAEGELRTINRDAPVKAFGDVGEMGQYTTFDATPSAYAFNADASGHVTTNGTGAVGFIVYDNDDNIIGFYNTTSFKLPANAGSNYVIKAVAGNGSLTVAEKDASITVDATDFPRTDKWYTFKSKGQANRYVDSQGAGSGLIGTLQASSSAVNDDTSMHWRFEPRNASGTEFDIINREDGSYIDPTVSWNSQERTTATQPSAGWKVEPAGDYYYISSGSTQLNQTGPALSYQIYNWGSGSSTEDNCLFTISAVEQEEHFTPTTAEVYTINNTNSNRGALMSAPSQSEKWVWSSGKNSQTFNASDANCQWIIVPAESEGQYYLYNVGKQKFVVPTRSGDYPGFSWMFSSDAVPVCLSAQSDGTFKMSTTSDNICLSVSNSYTGPIINYDDEGALFSITRQAETSDAITSQLTAAMAARPSENLSQSLHAVDGKSYATLYLDYDAQTDENTKAYYISEAGNGYAQLTPVGNEGRNIPAYTAVVLVNENGETDVTLNAGFSVSSGYGEVVAESTNLLKGTLTAIQLDLSDETPYYSLGRMNGEIGFYKFSGNGTTTITLGAGKAYLEVPAGNGVKGYTFDFDNATAIEMVNGQRSTANAIYNLSGQRLSKPQHGVNIVDGKKVFIK